MKNHKCILLTRLAGFLMLLFLLTGLKAESKTAPVSGLRIATFDVDATPPTGYQMAYNPVVRSYDIGLRAKGAVLLGAGQPVVVVCMDWLVIVNESQDEFKRALAEAAGTTPDRVEVHCLHPHDAPIGDIKQGFVKTTLANMQAAIREAIPNAQPVTHIGLGQAQVYKVASNRRIMGDDGKVRAGRMSSCQDSLVRAEPEGLIDPMVSVVSFWNGEKPVAVMSFYASHPQSYYRLGIPNPDFPGIARFYRQLAVPDALHIHFTGAGGNVAAGKYNDGSHEMRGVLAERLADGMKRAWEESKRFPVKASDVAWTVEPVRIAPDTTKKTGFNFESFVARYRAGKTLNVACLSLGNSRILFMPGELFVEYQLAAKKMRPDLFVAMAAYGDTGTGYIPTASAFREGGYEVGASNVTPQAEEALMTAMRKLLKAK
jgi:hypothetical protein